MLGQPVSMLIPRVVGFKLSGSIPAGATATDVVLTITEMLRRHGVVGKFVEFYGEGVSRRAAGEPRDDRQHEPRVRLHLRDLPDRRRHPGVPAPHRSLAPSRSRSSRRTPRSRGCGCTPAPTSPRRATASASSSTCRPSCRPSPGPKRPQDRIVVAEAKELRKFCRPTSHREGDSRRLPAGDPSREARGIGRQAGRQARRRSGPVNGRRRSIDHGVSITSCTNTSNPSVMMAAAMLAKNAVERGLSVAPWVKTSMAPGSKVVTGYYEKAGMWPYLEKLGFHLVGYGCTTCIGNSGPLPRTSPPRSTSNDLAVVSVLSGNRNFEGRINPDVKMNYLASPPLVIAYALAGTMDFDFDLEPLGQDTGRQRRLPQGHLAGPDRRRGDDRRARSARRCSPPTTPTSSPVTSAGSRCRRPRATPSTGTPTPPTSASPRTSTGCSSSRRRSRTSPTPGCSPSSATR